MVPIQFLLFIWLLLCLPTTEANESFLLYNTWNQLCLTHVPAGAQGEACNPSDPNQEWQWMSGLYLRNVGSGLCVTSISITPWFAMQSCVKGSDDQRMICSYNVIKGSHRGKNQEQLGMTSNSYHMHGGTAPIRKRWQVYGAGEKSICNGKSFREDRKWWRLASHAMDVSSGLSPVIIFLKKITSSGSNVVILGSSGKMQEIYGYLEVISLAPHTLWGVNQGTKFYYAQEELSFDQTIANWISFSGEYILFDFTMPGKGYFVMTGNQFCTRLGITEDIPQGDDWECESLQNTLGDLSCGVTGCFGLIDGILHFREGITSDNPIGTTWIPVGNPQHELFVKIEAGPVYELWGITSDGYPYRRLGMCDGIPVGTAWELVPNLLLKDVSFGIFGPVGIAKDLDVVISQNGSPAPKRQREMDDFCTSEVPRCIYPGVDECVNSGTICNARFTPKIGDVNNEWRCLADTVLGEDGQVWVEGGTCLYTRHSSLRPIVFRYPVLGDFEKQLWLDTFCQNQDVSGCSEPYFANYNATSEELVCRTVVTTGSCPVITGLHEGLLNLSRGSCADNPLILPLASSQFSTDSGTGHSVKLYNNLGYCRTHNKNVLNDVYVTIDFLFLHKICAIGTMGFDGVAVDSYRVSYGIEMDIWNKSSLFGREYVFKGNVDATTLVKRYLPAPVIARWLRVTFTVTKGVRKCLQLEVYGSSLETEADSCQYYKDHLSATLDGIYYIYPKDTEIRKRVFCKGITDDETVVEYPFEELIDIEEIGCFRDDATRAMPVLYTVNDITECKAKAHAARYEVFGLQNYGVECFTGPQAHITYHKYGESDNCVNGNGGYWASSVYRIIKADKLFWPLNTTRDGAPGPIIHGKQAVNARQGSASRPLAIFPNHCVSNLELCTKGLSIEFWLWFNYTLDYATTTILKSGIKKGDSRGFMMFLKYHHVCMEIHMRSTWFKACIGPLGKPTYWLHIFANWDVAAGITLIVDGLEMRSQGIKTNRGRDKKGDIDSVLRLGHQFISNANRYDIAIHSLTIWSRKLSEDEVEARFTKGYIVASESESCKAVCEAKGLACDPVMSANGRKVSQRLGVTCSSDVPINAEDQAQPYITSSGACHGVGVTHSSCEASKAGVRRFCRCERPVHGKFTEWSQWSFCSRTCGSGRRVRTRSCTHPAPRLGGKDCKGITIMHDDCQELPCDVQDGILHEIWLGNPDIGLTKATNIYSIRAYPKYPTFSHIIEDFTTKSNHSFYGERFRTYFIAPESGDYKVIMECPNACLMSFRKRYKKTVKVFDIVSGPKTVSSTITDLVAGTKYYMFVISVYKADSTEFKLGFESTASGLNINPITKEYMSWKAQEQHGISRQVWDVRFLYFAGRYDAEDFVENAPEPDFKEEISEFEMERSGHFYAQRLQTYFLATSDGDYKFYMTCSVKCYLYIDDAYIFMDHYANIVSRWTSGNEATKTLEGGKFYKFVVLHYQRGTDSDFVALGVTLPNTIQLYPIGKTYLWLKIPEKLEIERTPGQKSTQHPVANALDGLLATCSMTGNTGDPWLRLESEFSFIVHSVAITNQIANPSALDNVHIKVGNTNPAQYDRNRLCYTVAHIPSGQTVSYPCNNPLSGRYVTIWLYGSNKVLAVCEIAVYGERPQVKKDKYQQGTQDGRVERWQISSSSHRARHDRYNIRLYHPYSSWCANEDAVDIFLEVRFVERRVVTAIIASGHPMENKYVTKAKIQYRDADTNWIYVKGTNNKNEFYFGRDPKYMLFKSAYYTKSLKFIPFAWFHRPCVRLAIVGCQWSKNFAWFVGELENTTRMLLSGAESGVTVDDKPAIYIPKTSLIQLCGFNIICLRNPQMCSGSFKFLFRVSMTDVSTDGIIFSTSGDNTSIVGTSVFLRNSNLVVVIRTVTRIWSVSAPADSLVGDTLEYVLIIWSYPGDITLKVKGVAYMAPYTVVPLRIPLAGDDLKNVIKFGGVDLNLNWVSLEVESYDVWLRKRIRDAADGWHTEWESWGYCSKSCGNSGVQYRNRRCTNPAPKFDGLECPTLKETRPCPKPSCDNDDGVLREIWMNKSPPKFSLTNVFDGYASYLEVVANFSLSYNDGPFAERLRTFLHANESGEFQFQLSCTYQCELWISPTDEIEGKVQIISHDASANGGVSLSTLTGSYNFVTGENYYIEVRSFEIKGARNHSLLTIKAPSMVGTGFSLVRHKPDCFHGLGVESGAIPDGLVFSHAYGSSMTQFAYHGRLNSDFPQCAKTLNDKAFYVDLHELHWIVAVVIQGYIKSGIESRVTSLQIKTRLNLLSSAITDVDNVYTIYNGNEDAETIKVINLTQPIRSRYVVMWMLSYAGDGCFRVDVIGCHAGNLAYQKETEHSDGTTSSRLAVDGSFGRSLYECTHSGPVDNMIWWLVDFGRAYYVGEVLIVGRKDCCWERMHNLQIRIGNLGGASSLLNSQCGELHSLWKPQHVASLSVQCDGYGQYLTIAKDGSVTDISLSEVAAFQIENDTILSNWSDCSVTCGYGLQQRRTICIKPYYCKSVEEVRPCFAEVECEILMQNCGQLHALGETETGTYKVRPNPVIENDIYVYCDHDTDGGGWLVLQRRSASGTLNMTQSWHLYQDGFGNVTTEFWVGNKYFSELTNHTAYEIMFVFKLTNGSVLRKTKCDSFNVSSEEENYRLQLGTCEGPDAKILRSSNWTEFSTWDKDNGFGLLNCASEITGWWFGSCDSYINSQTLSCFGQSSCDYDVTMMIKPDKVDGGWTHWTRWETCDKPCGGGNSSRARSCTHPPPTSGGADCEGPWNETRGCNTSPCPVIELNITMRFTQETWTAYLLELSSSGSQGLMTKITNNILAIYDNDPSISVVVHRFKQGSVVADVSIIYEALDDQQLIVLQEDLDQDGLLNQDMPVVYTQNELVVNEVLFGPPQIIESGNTSSTSIYIKWQPPNSTILYKLLGYRIFYKESNDTSLTMLVQAVEKNVLEIEITDLKYYTNYSVRVCAFSSAGNGVPTTAHDIITDEYIPIAAPVVVSAFNLSSTSLNISWLPVDLPLFRGIPTGYVLHYRIKTSDNTTAFLNATIDDYLVTSINISDLMKYTEYEMYMTATTIKGRGTRGAFVYFRTDEDVPSYPPDNITLVKNTSTSLLISWSAIPQRFVHGVLRGYVIEYWPVGNRNDIANATVDPLVTEVELTNLIKFTNYSIKFAGMTYKGVGNWSEIMLQTAEDIPDWGPMNLTGFNISETAINVSWSFIPQKYRHGIIIGYRVHYEDEHRHSESVTVPASQRSITLNHLHSYTLYNISVAGITKIGEGKNRTSVLTYTNPGAPSREPWDIICSGVSSYTISLYWYRFTPDLTGSLLSGYFMSYRAIGHPDATVYNVTLETFKYNYVAEGLKGYTNYSFEIYVYNPWGRSNTSTVVCRTEEGKPLASPSNLIAISKVAPDKVHLKWDTVPDIEMAGIRRGYTVTYRKIKEVGEFVDGDEKQINIFDPQQTDIFIEGLEYYCQYSFTVRVFNTMFYGDDSEKMYGETCNCLEDFYTNWCSYMPYVNTSDSGIFPPLIRSAIYGVCGNCSVFGQPKIYFETDIVGAAAEKPDLVQVKQSITDQSQINFPSIGRKDSKTFVPVIDSPGSVFVTKKPSLTMTVEYMFIGTIIGTLPLLGFAVITAMLSGIIMWCLERGKNSKDFPRSFNHGAREGFWWAFISMTTVGYGDRAPTTVQGRIFSIVWTLYGLVITGILVGNLTSSLTASVAFSLNEVNLYKAKIAAVDNSSEFKLGLSKGAVVNKGRDFSDILTVLHAVEVGSVEGALLDMYVVASCPELQNKDSPLIVKSIIQNPSTYGIELAGHATKLRQPFLNYLHNNAALVTSALEKYTTPVKKSEGEIDTSEVSEGDEINVLAPDSPIIKQPLLYSSIFLGVAVVFGLLAHCTLCKRRRNGAAVLPMSSSAEISSTLDKHVSKFCENSKTTLTNIKQKHRRELMACTKRWKLR